jgi:hypothetical protein
MKRKKGNNNKYWIWLLAVLLIITAFITGISIYLKQSPDVSSKYLWNKITGNPSELPPSVDSLLAKINKKNLIIDSLRNNLKKYERVNIHKKAMINVESGTLNMRSRPNIASDIIIRIPDSSYVDLLYYDLNFYYLNGNRGRWCKIKYADKEGWVWDGFLEIQNK